MSSPWSRPLASIGRFEVRATLGIGGFATVYRAYDPVLETEVAIKVLLPQFAADEHIGGRFLQEARLLRRVDSRHVVDVFDIGELADGTPYFVMELLTGGSLAARITRGVDVGSLATIVDALEDGLGALHAAGVVHRDVKPDNLLVAGSPPGAVHSPVAQGASGAATELRQGLLAPGERVVIADLGFAKDRDRTSVGPTLSGGTPHFRAPEQEVSGGEITDATDVYAATAVLWQLITGSLPPPARTLGAHVPSLPAEWQPVIERGMHVEPEMRPPTIAAWAAAVRAAIDTVGAIAPVSPGATDTGRTVTAAVGDPAQLCPYKGMAAFQPEDAGLFFGRGALVETLVTRLQRHPVLVVGGPSGSGKSSLLRAGLLPRLGRGAIAGSQAWDVALLTPGQDPIGELVHQLSRLRPAAGRLTAADLPHGARRWLEDGPPTLLAIDQFEELFALVEDPDARDLFVATLGEMTQSAHSRVRVAIAVRADFYGACAAHPWLAEQINAAQVLVGPMTRAELREAIVLPAQRAGLRLEDGLVDTLLDDVGDGVGTLPLLGHALVETWLRRRGPTLSLDGYRAAGGVSGAIAQRAEEVCAALTPTEQDAVRRLMLRLTNPGEGAPDTRRRVALDVLAHDAEMMPIVGRLAAARLLTVDDTSVEVAHEALLHSWPRLRRWIDDDREHLRFRRRLGAAAADWVANDRTPDLLHRGTALATALDWLERRAPGEVEPHTVAFLHAGRDLRDAELEAERDRRERAQRNRRRAMSALAALAVTAVVASVAAFVALGQSRANERDAEQAVVQALATAAAADADSAPLTGIALALESLERADGSSALARDALVTARAALDERRALPQEFGAPVAVGDMISIAISPDGTRFLTGGRTGEVVVWDRAAQLELGRHDVHDAGVEAIVVAPGGERAVTVGGSTAIAWTLGAGDPAPDLLTRLDAGAARIWDAAFSPNGELLVLATEADGLVVVDPVTGDPAAAPFRAGTVDFLSVVFLDDRHVAAGDGRGAVWVVDVLAGDTVPPGVTADEPIGDRIALGGIDNNDVWELVVDRSQGILHASSDDNTVRSFAFGASALGATTDPAPPLTPVGEPLTILENPRGIEVVGAGDTGGLVVGDRSGRLSLVVAGAADVRFSSRRVHADRIIDTAVAPGWAVTLGDDQAVQVWRLIGEEGEAAPTVAQVAVPSGLALSPSGGHVAVATTEGAIVLAGTGEQRRSTGGEALAVAFTTDDVVVVGGRDGVVRLLRVASGDVVGQVDLGAPVRSLAVSPDGSLVATGDDTGRVALWRGDDLVSVRDLVRHRNAQVTDLVFTADGDVVVSVGFDGLRASGVDGGETQFLDVAQDGVRTVDVHPDGRVYAVGGAQERLDIVSSSGDLLRSLSPHPGGVWDVAFSSDGATVAATGRDGAVQLWDWATGSRLGPPFTLHAARPGVASGPVLRADDGGRFWVAGPVPSADPAASDGEPTGSVRLLEVLDLGAACALGADVITEAMRSEVLGDDPVRACRD